VIQKAICGFLGCALLAFGGNALAFTLITPPPPPEQTAPSSDVTTATTLPLAAQPIVGTLRAQMLNRRLRGNEKLSQADRMVALNAHADTVSDAGTFVAALGDAPGTGAGADTSHALWISSAYNSVENEFSRTSFYGSTQNILAGYDVTRSSRVVLGVAVGYEADNFVTRFNAGDEKTRGFNVTPYFSFLLSDTWSVDLSLGYGSFDTKQSRSVGSTVITIPLGVDAVTSDVSSTRDFAALNLTNVSTAGNWKLTGSAGFLGTRRKQEAYVESDGTSVASTNQSVEQYNLLGEAAYGRGAGEVYLGAVYEYVRNPPTVQFPSGEQPPVDKDSYVLAAGWRYFGRGMTTNFAFTGRAGQQDVKEYGFYMMLRVDL
jgi:Autotransporter beta-domain